MPVISLAMFVVEDIIIFRCSLKTKSLLVRTTISRVNVLSRLVWSFVFCRMASGDAVSSSLFNIVACPFCPTVGSGRNFGLDDYLLGVSVKGNVRSQVGNRVTACSFAVGEPTMS